MTHSQRVLVLDGQSNAALACVRSLGRAGHSVLVASPVWRPLAGWSRFCTSVYRHRGFTTGAFRDMRNWARREGVTVVMPTSEESCSLCNAEREAWEGQGVILGCGPSEMLNYAFDKALTIQTAEACGLQVPATRYPRTLEECVAAAAELGFPCIIKPRFSQVWDGHGFHPSRGVAYVATPEGLENAVRPRVENGFWPMIQAFVP